MQCVTHFWAKWYSLPCVFCFDFYEAKRKRIPSGVPLSCNNHPPATLWEPLLSPLHVHTQGSSAHGNVCSWTPEAFSLTEQLRKISKRLNHVWPKLALKMLFRAQGAAFAAWSLATLTLITHRGVQRITLSQESVCKVNMSSKAEHCKMKKIFNSVLLSSVSRLAFSFFKNLLLSTYKVIAFPSSMRD